MKLILSTFLLFTYYCLVSQSSPPTVTEGEQRMEAYEQRLKLTEHSLLKDMPVENIGPTVFSGRVSDIDVNPEDPTQFYVAYASGGLWYTDNNGTSFSPLFDDQPVMTIGDIAVDWDNEMVWLGSGEVNSSRSSYAGNGIYKSNDGGKSWEHKGLPESHHIGRVIIHPENPDIVWVAVLGHLYSPNPERGIYKTTDGGKNWQQVLYVNDNTGGVDLLLDPVNPEIMYAAMWERERRAWNFVESGSGSGIFKSMDGGENWTRLNTEGSEFPSGKGVGRIGLTAGLENGKTILYAILDNYDRRPPEKEDKEKGLTKNELKEMDKETFLQLEEKGISDFLHDNNFPRKYNAKKVIQMVNEDKILPKALAEYLEDANSLLFNTEVIGAEVYRSDDNGNHWERTHEDYLDGVFYSYGYYFAQIRVDRYHPDHVYIMGVPILKSKDAGKTWENINGDNVHVDHHDLWVNPERKGHLINGNDGGINISYDDGENWIKCNSVPVGQFYYIAVDNQQPYNVYGGLQDNGVWMGPNTYTASSRWHSTGQYPYKSILGGDGMQVQIDKRDNNTVYTGLQFGNYFRLDLNEDKRDRITPIHELGERPYRWNWQSPILLSSHNQDIVYFGANLMMRSMDKGESFTPISDDLTNGGKKGDVAYGTITTIDESPFKFGLIYAGTDDGNIHVTKDGGNSWKKINDGLPADMWVSRIIASTHEKGRVYVVLNGYRWDHFTPYVFVSEDYGNTWKSIVGNLPHESLNVIKEDSENPDLLFVGSDHGLYYSSNRGINYHRVGNLPHVSIHDVVIHPENGDLIIGTHGRSIYKTTIVPLREVLTAEDKDLIVFSPEEQRYRSNWGQQLASYRDPFTPEVPFFVYQKYAGDFTLEVYADDDLMIYQTEISARSGITQQTYHMNVGEEYIQRYQEWLNIDAEEAITLDPADNGNIYLKSGEYDFIIKKGDLESKTKLVIR